MLVKDNFDHLYNPLIKVYWKISLKLNFFNRADSLNDITWGLEVKQLTYSVLDTFNGSQLITRLVLRLFYTTLDQLIMLVLILFRVLAVHANQKVVHCVLFVEVLKRFRQLFVLPEVSVDLFSDELSSRNLLTLFNFEARTLFFHLFLVF
jgi:hypothetical protein